MQRSSKSNNNSNKNNSNPFDKDVVPHSIKGPRPSSDPPVVLPQPPWFTVFTIFMWRLLFLIVVLKAGKYVAEANGLRFKADPDTTCSEAYRKNPTKETCLATNDHFTRPCEYCVTKKGNVFCYNADEAKWSRWFDRAKCEIRPTATRVKASSKRKQRKKKIAAARNAARESAKAAAPSEAKLVVMDQKKPQQQSIKDSL